MTIADQIDAIAGALRVMLAGLEPGQYAAHLYALDDLDRAIGHLEMAARSLRQGETLKAAEAFGGGR